MAFYSDKAPHVRQGAILTNKRLGAVLSTIRSDQQARDRQRLVSRKLTNRQKKRIRGALIQLAAPDGACELREVCAGEGEEHVALVRCVRVR